MKIKIVMPGWAGFTGYLGMTEFADGVSVHDVGKIEAQRLASCVSIETMDGHNPSAAQEIIDSRSVALPLATTPAAEKPDESAVMAMTYTPAELGEIADKGGIKAIREIADKFGVKGKSISEIISGLSAIAPKVVDQPASAEDASTASAE
jgi:hypothetical protein